VTKKVVGGVFVLSCLLADPKAPATPVAEKLIGGTTISDGTAATTASKYLITVKYVIYHPDFGMLRKFSSVSSAM
jgi:hypothetical protein